MIDESHIRKLSDRFLALEREMADPLVATNHRKSRELADEYGRLKRIVELGDRFFKAKRDMEDHRLLIGDQNADPDLKALAADESAEIQGRLPSLEMDLLIAFLPPDRKDAGNAIVEIRAGTGGEEAALFAADLFRMYGKFAESRKWKIAILDASASTIGGYKEVIFSVEGADAYGRLKYESGGHRVQRVPVTEAQGRIHTSAATVAVFPEAEEQDEIELKPDELRIDIFCSSGPGGQSVNTTYSAIRITHLPTGIVAQSQDERSQQRNKEKAMRVLKARILDARRQKEAERMTNERRSLIGTGDRSQRIRTYNFPQNRMTDHRINLTLYTLDRVIEGNLNPLHDALYQHDIEIRLKEATAAAG